MDFVSLAQERRWTAKTIFHFGSGAHHLVGRQAGAELGNQVLAISASREEYQIYMDLVLADANLAGHYMLLFGDVYTLTSPLLPRFDLINLFHVCEFYRPEHRVYAALDDRSLVGLFLQRCRLGGRLLFYAGSDGFAKARPILRYWSRAGMMRFEGAYRSLRIYRRLGSASRSGSRRGTRARGS
jgi:hypothetical protein